MKVVAHRGGYYLNDTLVENTLPTIKEAVKEKCVDMIEIDLNLSKDNKIIIFHDEVIQEKNIDEYLYDELKLFGIPSLTSVLELVKDKKMLYLDIKNPKVVKLLLPLIDEYPNVNVLFASFDLETMKLLKTYFPMYDRFLISESSSWTDKFMIEHPTLYTGIVENVNVLDYSHALIFKSKNIPYYVYTVNNPEDIIQYSELLTGVITDYPLRFTIYGCFGYFT